MSSRTVTDLGIVVLLVLMLGTGLPRDWPGMRTIRGWVVPVAEAVGLSQKNWRLFAPNVDKINAWVEVTITYEDGSRSTVTTTDWQARSALQALAGGRAPKIEGYLHQEGWSALWRPYMRWAIRQATPPRALTPVDHVTLTRHSWRVPHPRRLERARRRFGPVLPPPRERYPRTEVYATWRPGKALVKGPDLDGDGQVDTPQATDPEATE